MYTVYVRKLANKYLTLERFIWYILLRFDMTVSSIEFEGDRVSTATTFASIAGFICSRLRARVRL